MHFIHLNINNFLSKIDEIRYIAKLTNVTVTGSNTINKEILHLTRSCLFFFTHSLKQIIWRPTKITDQIATLIDYILMNSPDKVSQSGIIGLGLSDHDLIFCTRKTSLPKSQKYNEIFVRSKKRYSAEKVLNILRKIVFPNYLTYTCKKGCLLRFCIYICRSNKFHNPSKKVHSEDQPKTLVW